MVTLWLLVLTYLYAKRRLNLQWQSCPLCGGCTDGGQRLMKGIWGVEEHDTRGSRFQERRQSTVKNH